MENHYKDNISWLCERRNLSLAEFEDIIAIPKVRFMDPTPSELIKIANYFGFDLDTLVKKDLRLIQRIKPENIKLIVLDVDGTMTDGGMYYTESGDQMKKFHAKDGLAIRRKVKEGKRFGIISHAFRSESIQDRAKLLNIELVYVGSEQKLTILQQWCDDLKIGLHEVAFVGDDLNDLEVMEKVGFAACPADAVKQIKRIAQVVLTKNGGDACIREFLDEWMS